MNRVYKVIFNRSRQLVQVVPEYARNKGKTVSESRKGGIRGLAKVLLSLLAAFMIASPGYAADSTGGSTDSGNTTYISDTNTDAQNIQALDKQVAQNAQDIAANKTAADTNTADIATNKTDIETNKTSIAANKTAIGKNTADIATNAANISDNKTAIADNKTAIDKNTSAISANTSNISINTQNIAANKTNITDNTTAINANKTSIAANTSDITSLKDLSNITDAGKTVIKEQAKQAVKVAAGNRVTVTPTGSETGDGTITYTVSANNDGTISIGDTNLVSGATLYTELRPASAGTYYYISSDSTTAQNLAALDATLYKALTALDLDTTGTSYTSTLSKYFKVNPEVTTASDGTKTYAADADAQGTDSVAIGPNAKVNTTGENGVAIGNGAVTGADKYTKILSDKTTTEVPAAGGVDSVAIGTDAANQGNASVALGKGAQVLNDFDSSTNTAVVKTGDVAIGSGATVDSSLDSTAIGTSADVRYGEDSLALGSSAKVDTAKQAVALGYKASVADGADGSLALGDEASALSSYATAIGYKASANTAGSIALGNGANTGGDGGGIAIGTSAAADGRSVAIGFTDNTAANNYDSVAIGNGAQANVDRSISIGLDAGKGSSSTKGSSEGSLIAIGDNAGQNVAGMRNVAVGLQAGSTVKSNENIAIGSYAGTNINNVVDGKMQDGSNISIGNKANYSTAAQSIIDSVAIGRETAAGTDGVALGAAAKASGEHSVALGFNAQASDTDSVALGNGASAADGNVAIGSSSAAPAVSTLGTVKDGIVYKTATSTDSSGTATTTYTELTSAFTNTPLSSTSHYVSFGISDGNTTVERRLSNVADGVFDSDAVTVKQLNTAYSNLQGLIKGIDTSSLDTYSTSVIDSKVADVKAEIAAAKTKYFSVNGDSATSTGNNDNTGASTGGADAMAIGPNAYATATKSLAVGNNVSASGVHSIALGTADNPTTSSGSTTTHYTSSEGENSVAVGYSTIAQSNDSIAIGTRATVYTSDTTDSTATKTGARGIAIGYQAETRRDDGTALGSQAVAQGTESLALGYKASASGTGSLAAGSQSSTDGDGSVALGLSNTVIGTNVTAVGTTNTSSGSWGGITASGLFGDQNKIQAYSDTNVSNTVTGVYTLGSGNTVDQANKINKVTNVTLLGQGNSVAAGSNETSYQNTINNVTVIGGSNTVKGYEQSTTSWSTLENDTVLGYGNTIDASQQATPVSNIQILGNKVTAALGNSVYLGTEAAYVSAAAASNDAETLAVQQGDADAEASDEYKAAATDTERNTIKQKYKAKYLYKARVAAMEASGTTAGVNQYDQDNTYGNASSYTYAAGTPTGVITVGSVGSERRIQNVAAGLVSASSTDAVNGSQLYALTRQLRFGGDNSTIGKTADGDADVVKRGSNEALSIIGGETDSTKLTDNNIGVMADSTNNTLTVKLSKNVNLGNDGSVVTGNTTLDNTGLTITNGPKFTSSGIDAASQQIKNVTAGTDDTDAANVEQVKAAAAEATTEVKAGTNASLGTVETSTADKHKIYTVNVDNLAVKANGTGTAAVELAKGINFQNGTNTTATVGTDGTVTISATHNKLRTASAASTGTKDDVALTLTDADGNTVISTGLKNTYTTVSKDGNAHTVTFARNDGINETLSLGDLDGATTEALAAAAAKATSEVTNGTNVASVVKTTGSNGQNIYTVNVDDLAVKTTDGIQKSVRLADGLVFANGTNTTATVGDNGTITFNVSDAAIKTQAKDAINMTAGTNVSVGTETSMDGLSKTFTISATHNALKTASLTKKSNDVSTLTITGNDGDSASVDIKNTYLTVSKDPASKTVTFTSNDGTTPAATLSLSDFGAASTADVEAAQAAAATEVRAGTNASLGDVETDQTDQHKIYTVNVDNLSVKANGEEVRSVTLNKGLTFDNGTNTTASVGEGGVVSYSLDPEISLIQVTTGSSVLKDNGLTIAGGPSVLKTGIDAGNQKITGVLAGTETIDAVNKGQLDALTNTVNGGWTIQAGNASGNAQTVKPGDAVTLDAGNNLTVAQDGTTFTYSLAGELTGLTSVTAVDAKNNQAVLTGEGLKVMDGEGNSLTQHANTIRLHASTSAADDTSKDVVLNNDGLVNGGNKIRGVAAGEVTADSKEAVNGSQLYDLQQKVGSGWKISGDDTTQATNIGAGAQVSVKSGQYAKATVNKSDTGAVIQYDVQTQAITTSSGQAQTAGDGVATAQDVVDAINASYWTVTSGETGTGKATGTAVSHVTAGTTVTLQAGDNLLLTQAGDSFTYALDPVVTGMTSISFTGMGAGDDGKTVNDLVIGLQNGGGANPNRGYYITGLSNTEWNQSNYQGDRAATESQLLKAIQQVSVAGGGGGFGLTANEGANNDGDKTVTQALGSTIAVLGDGTYDKDGNVVKAGNVKTVAHTDTTGLTGSIQIQLNKDIDLGADGSLQAGGVTLKNNSVTVGTDGVMISSSGTDRTVSNLSNTQWDTAKANQEASAGGYIGSTKAATESQLQQAISQVTTTAQNNEQHIQTGEYTIGKNPDGTDRTDTHSVSMDVVDGQGRKQGSVVIKDVAKASEVGDVSQLHDTLKNSDGTKNVTGAINNLDDRVTGLDNRMDQIYTTAGQHSSVSTEDNIQVDSQSKNGTGGTDYKLSLNKEKIDLKNVTIEGNAGAVSAKTVTAEKYNVGDKTYISSDGINANSQKITNIQAGTDDTDAANVGQVRAADEQLAEGIEQNTRNIGQLSRDVDKLDSRIDRVGAGAAALAALHPGAYDPNDKVDFSAGLGSYRGAGAAAVGMYYHPDDRTILSMGIAMGGGENMVNAGITWKMGRRTPTAPQPVPVKAAPAASALMPVTAPTSAVRPAETAPVVKPAVVRNSVRPMETAAAAPEAIAVAAPVRPVSALRPAAALKPADGNAQLLELLARQTAILEKLAEQKAAPEAESKVNGDDLFTDVPENHWAYAYALKLEQAGALKGLAGLQVAGNPLLTRKDFAKILYTALKNGATTNPILNQDGSLNRMASEFRAELKEVKG